MELSARIYVAGHRGLAGSALVRRLASGGFRNLLTRTHAELELTDQATKDMVKLQLEAFEKFVRKQTGK